MSNDTTPATVRGSDSSEGLGGGQPEDHKHLAAELIRLANILRDCGRLVSRNGEQILRQAAESLAAANAPQPAEPAEIGCNEGLGGVDCIGLALDLEARATTVESQTTERAMRAAAHGLRLLAAAQPPERVPRCLSDAEIERLAAVDFPSKQWPACVRLLRAAGCVEPLNVL